MCMKQVLRLGHYFLLLLLLLLFFFCRLFHLQLDSRQETDAVPLSSLFLPFLFLLYFLISASLFLSLPSIAAAIFSPVISYLSISTSLLLFPPSSLHCLTLFLPSSPFPFCHTSLSCFPPSFLLIPFLSILFRLYFYFSYLFFLPSHVFPCFFFFRLFSQLPDTSSVSFCLSNTILSAITNKTTFEVLRQEV